MTENWRKAAQPLRDDAAERDRAGAEPPSEVHLLCGSGLLPLLIPAVTR